MAEQLPVLFVDDSNSASELARELVDSDFPVIEAIVELPLEKSTKFQDELLYCINNFVPSAGYDLYLTTDGNFDIVVYKNKPDHRHIWEVKRIVFAPDVHD